jgi:hypothetical protein
LRIHASSRIVNSTIATPREILFTLIKATFLASSAPTQLVAQSARDLAVLIDFAQDRCRAAFANRSFAEKPKMGELQMDWLRSEDLKEEKT